MTLRVLKCAQSELEMTLRVLKCSQSELEMTRGVVKGSYALRGFGFAELVNEALAVR